ncbi:methyl-accepting chemotaxis protein [Paracerasibacillus soli]|uniref:Methyl-accepting chemotaxis protein n=1 Tax=Paracerasibacillus soli TaxID=480284 RepID=A0ABU5CU64_9BACI|nr:methyl-accepting chemotaxis protein [Virgibacillus soli]MDY0409846.1 methyl-accepting chemotaxis protein [Virgibacillus soli]
MLFLFCIACLILLIIVFLLLKNMLKALPSITNRMKLLAAGDLSQEDLQANSNDEIGQLVVSTNQMNQRVRELLNRIRNVSEIVSTHGEELTQSANEVKMGSRQIATTMQELAMGAESQANETNELSDGMGLFSNKVQNANEMGGNITRSSHAVLDLTNKGNEFMQRSTEKMEKVNEPSLKQYRK